MSSSSYLIDFEGNLWIFGNNEDGQLGHGDKAYINTPETINTLKDIQQISYGSCGYHFLDVVAPKALKIKYLSLGKTVTDNLEQETLNQFQFPKK